MSSGLYSGSGAKDFQEDDERKGFPRGLEADCLESFLVESVSE